jgi:hypothetical protein
MRHRATLTVAAALLLAGCGTSTGSTMYDALPSDAWPALDGVRVVSSEGYAGNSCCEPYSGGRDIKLDVTGHNGDPREFVKAALLDLGWDSERCVRAVLCAKHDGTVAILHEPDRQQRERGIDVTVSLERTR